MTPTIMRGMNSQQGVKNHNAKLTPEMVYDIRNLYKKGSITQKELAAIFGVTQSQISRIVRANRWLA